MTPPTLVKADMREVMLAGGDAIGVFIAVVVVMKYRSNTQGNSMLLRLDGPFSVFKLRYRK